MLLGENNRKHEIYTIGVPTVAQNPTTVAGAAVEVQDRSPILCGGLRDLVLPHLGLRFNPWPRKFHVLWMQPRKKKIPFSAYWEAKKDCL